MDTIITVNPLDVIVEAGHSGSFYIVAYSYDGNKPQRFVHDHIFDNEETAVVQASKVITRGHINTNHWARFVPSEA